jgi:hypothetical protein
LSFALDIQGQVLKFLKNADTDTVYFLMRTDEVWVSDFTDIKNGVL